MTTNKNLGLSVVLFTFFCIWLSRTYAEGELIPDDVSVVRGVVGSFLNDSGYSEKLNASTNLPQLTSVRTAYNVFPSYIFRMAEGANISVSKEGLIREFFAPPNILSGRSVGHVVLAKRLIKRLIPKEVQVTGGLVRESEDIVQYWFQREIEDIPVDGQGVKLVFHGQTGNLLFLQNTIEKVDVADQILKPIVTRKSASQTARDVMDRDIHSSRWTKLIAEDDAEVDIPDDESARLLLVSPNSRFQDDSPRTPVRIHPSSWVLAYEIVAQVKNKQLTDDKDQMKLRAKVWVDAKTGHVIGGY